ncbi:MAG: hypothetical protein ACM3L6_03680 [Deltaproteobacteria bacterium]
MKILKISLIALVAVCLAAGTAMAAPGKGKAKGLENENHGAVAKAAAHEAKALRALKGQSCAKQEQARLQGVAKRTEAPPAETPRTATSMKSAEKALAKLEHARWAYNPNDTRGQGNMGKVDMLDPYGQDKDSDRLALYGNRGRVIREVVEPEPTPEDPPAEPPAEQPPAEDPPTQDPPPDWPPF